MATPSDAPQDWRHRLWAARDPGLLVLGAVLLFLAPGLPGDARIVVLPALLLAPGYAFLRLLGQPADGRAISVAVPASIVLAICAGLLLDVSDVRLDPVSLGFTLGSGTALFLAGSYARLLTRRPPDGGGPAPRPDRETVPPRDALRDPRDSHDPRDSRDPRPSPRHSRVPGPAPRPPWPDPQPEPRGEQRPPWAAAPQPGPGPGQGPGAQRDPRPEPPRDAPYDERWLRSTMTNGVMVVGMHRSGTSAVTRVINLLGVPLGREDDIYSAQDNPSGHWESRTLCALNDVILRTFGGFDMAMPSMPRSWLSSRTTDHLKDVMRATFDEVYQGGRWLWKDPRICLTLPLWRQVLDDFCVVLVLRDADPVMRSLHRREGYPMLYCYALWDDYVRKAVAAAAGLPVVVVDFDSMAEDPARHVKLLAEGLSAVGVELDGEIESATASLQRPAGSRRPAGRGAGRSLDTALKSVPAVSQAFQPPSLPRQPLWVRPALEAGCAWLKFRERWLDV